MGTRRGIAAGAVLLVLFAGGCFFPPDPGEPEPPLCLDADDDTPVGSEVVSYTLPNPNSSISFSDSLCAGGDVDHIVAEITSGIAATSSIACDGPMTVDVIVGGETIGTVPCDDGSPFVSGEEPYSAETRVFRFQADDPADEVNYSFKATVTAA